MWDRHFDGFCVIKKRKARPSDGLTLLRAQNLHAYRVSHLNGLGFSRRRSLDVLKWRVALAEQRERHSENEYRPTIKGGLAAATIRTYVKEVYALFDFLEAQGDLAVSPTAKLKLPPPEDSDLKFIRDDDLVALLKVVEGRSRRDFAIIMLLADTGMRAGELCTLTMDRLDLTRQIARVKGKTKHYGDCPFVALTRDALQDYLDVRPEVAAREVFLSKSNEPLSTGALYQMLDEMAVMARVRGPHNPHAFRHAAARAVLLAGGTLKDVQIKLRHTNMKVTADSYAHLSDLEQQQRLARLSPVTRLYAQQEEKARDLLTSQERSEQVQKGGRNRGHLRLVGNGRK